MKIMGLSLTQLKNLAGKNILVFCLFFGGFFLALFVLIYAYGNVMPSKYWANAIDPGSRTMDVYFDRQLTMQEEFLYFLDEYGIQDVYVDYYAPEYDIYTSDIGLCVRALRDNDREQTIMFAPLFDDARLAENVVIVSPSHKGNSMKIGGKEFEIIKKTSFMDDAIAFIPIQSYLSQQLGVDAIHYVFQDYYSNAALTEIAQKAERYFPEGNIQLIANPLEEIDAQDRAAVFAICIVFAAAMCISAALFLYLVRENASGYISNGIMGDGKRKIFLCILLQSVLLFLMAFVPACTLHIGFYALFDRWLNVYQGIVYTGKDYATIFLLTFLVKMMIDIPVIWRFTSKTFVQMQSKMTGKGKRL